MLQGPSGRLNEINTYLFDKPYTTREIFADPYLSSMVWYYTLLDAGQERPFTRVEFSTLTAVARQEIIPQIRQMEQRLGRPAAFLQRRFQWNDPVLMKTVFDMAALQLRMSYSREDMDAYLRMLDWSFTNRARVENLEKNLRNETGKPALVAAAHPPVIIEVAGSPTRPVKVKAPAKQQPPIQSKSTVAAVRPAFTSPTATSPARPNTIPPSTGPAARPPAQPATKRSAHSALGLESRRTRCRVSSASLGRCDWRALGQLSVRNCALNSS